MSRPKTQPSTRIIRAYEDDVSRWRVQFPGIKSADFLRMMYNTSLLKTEGMLKEKDFKNKLGRFLYGNLWKTDRKKR